MAGGTWSPTEKKVRPGFYLNFIAAALAAIKPGARGVVAVPVKANWGPPKEFIDIASEKELLDAYTADMSGGATAYDTIRFALLGGARRIVAYRLVDTLAAQSSLILKDTSGTPVNVITLKSKYPSTRAFKVTVRDNPVDSINKQDIVLYEDTALLYTFTFVKGASGVDAAVAAVNNDSGNKWIIAEKIAAGNGILAPITTQSLTGGNAGISGVLNQDYVDATAKFETRQFNIFVLDGMSDSALQTSVVAWIKRLRSEGKGVIAIMGGSATADADPVQGNTRSTSFNHEGIVNLITGATLDGISYSSAQVAPFIAGLIAGQRLNESITYATTPFDDVNLRLTSTQIEDSLKSGSLVLVHDGEKVIVEQGINTLTSLREGQNDQWKKIRAIRTMDAINADLLKASQDSYIGKVNNNDDGKVALLSAYKRYMETLVTGGVIERDYLVYLDPAYHAPGTATPAAPDEVYPKWEARIVDSMEKIYGTFVVR